jgi:hypothetical protein
MMVQAVVCRSSMPERKLDCRGHPNFCRIAARIIGRYGFCLRFERLA